jgi:hypothetical protein
MRPAERREPTNELRQHIVCDPARFHGELDADAVPGFGDVDHGEIADADLRTTAPRSGKLPGPGVVFDDHDSHANCASASQPVRVARSRVRRTQSDADSPELSRRLSNSCLETTRDADA